MTTDINRVILGFMEYTHPTINFRNLNDGDSQRHLSRMKETIESISKDIIDNINMILKEKHEKIL